MVLVFLHNLWGWFVLARALFGFDAFFFLYGQTITNSRLELWLLKRAYKRIVFIYVGSDSRPPFIDGGRFPLSDGAPDIALVNVLARQCKRRIRLHEKFADYLVNAPATAQFHERKFINWFAMGIPNDSVQSDGQPLSSDCVRILHSPSNPAVKGSQEIHTIIDRLQKKGYPIKFVKVEGMPYEVVLRELSVCDFVVDQLYSDSPLAAFASEAAFAGKPAVVGGYFAKAVASYLQPQDMPPSLFVLPADIEAAIERLVIDRAFRLELGAKARRFVTTHWTAKAVAERYLKLLNDDIPENWWFDPMDVRYVRGCGMPQAHASRLVRELIARYGVRSLQVADKPELEQAFVRLAATPEHREDA
ncbi:MAG: hypothetical protein ABI583_08085 [Betaproteobacteria bacterium]